MALRVGRQAHGHLWALALVALACGLQCSHAAPRDGRRPVPVHQPTWSGEFAATLWFGGGANPAVRAASNATTKPEPVHVAFSAALRAMRHQAGSLPEASVVLSTCANTTLGPPLRVHDGHSGCTVHEGLPPCAFPADYLTGVVWRQFLGGTNVTATGNSTSSPWAYAGQTTIVSHGGTHVACSVWKADGVINGSVVATLLYYESVATTGAPAPVRLRYMLDGHVVGETNVTAFKLLNATAHNTTQLLAIPSGCPNATMPGSHAASVARTVAHTPGAGASSRQSAHVSIESGADSASQCADLAHKLGDILGDLNGDKGEECLDAAEEATAACFDVGALLLETGVPEVVCPALGAALALKCTVIGLTRAVTGAGIAGALDDWCQRRECPPCAHGTCVTGSAFCECDEGWTGAYCSQRGSGGGSGGCHEGTYLCGARPSRWTCISNDLTCCAAAGARFAYACSGDCLPPRVVAGHPVPSCIYTCSFMGDSCQVGGYSGFCEWNLGLLCEVIDDYCTGTCSWNLCGAPPVPPLAE